jgi:hypothetical protein
MNEWRHDVQKENIKSGVSVFWSGSAQGLVQLIFGLFAEGPKVQFFRFQMDSVAIGKLDDFRNRISAAALLNEIDHVSSTFS